VVSTEESSGVREVWVVSCALGRFEDVERHNVHKTTQTLRKPVGWYRTEVMLIFEGSGE
jgi:hypothetical protein